MTVRLPLIVAVSALASTHAGPAARAHQFSGHLATHSRSVVYAAQGVTVGPPSARAAHYAAISSLRTSASAIAALRRTRWALDAFKTGKPKASLHTVVERHPVAPGVRTGVPYQAWVITVRGPVIFTGGPGSTPPIHPKCTDVAIYDLQLGRWTVSLQNC